LIDGGRRRAVAGAAAMLALGGCGLQPPTPRTPMQTIRSKGPCAGRAPVLVVLLPGAYSKPQEFVDEGFVDAVRRRGLAADVVVADAHLGYYQDRSVLVRLHEDILRPARAEGYAKVWLVGISLGAFGSLLYSARRGAEVDGVVALAPYLGRRTLLKEIIDDGGPAHWRTQVHARDDDDGEREIWEWLAAPRPNGPPVWLGIGRDDRFVDASRLLAQALPADRYTEVEGGHEWPPWRALWNAWLDRGLLSRGCGVA